MQQQGVERREEGREGKVRRVRKDRRKGWWKKKMERKMQQEGRQK